MPFRCHGQTARGGEIERAGITGDLPNDESQARAAQPLFKREQRILRFFRSNMNQPVTQPHRKTRHIGPSAKAHRRPVLHPQPASFIPLRGARFV